MTLRERIARAIRKNTRCSDLWESLNAAQAIIDELGLVEENEYHTRRHRHVTPWEET